MKLKVKILDNSNKNKGFSLIELSIVLIILGLLVAGVTGGASLIESAKQRKIINKFRNFETAYYTYYTMYNRVPGSSSKDVTTICYNNSSECGSFGDLKKENLINEDILTHISYTGEGRHIDYIIENSLPFLDNEKQKIRWSMTNTKAWWNLRNISSHHNAIFLSGSMNNDWVYNITNEDNKVYEYMKSIDSKIDDGEASSGKFRILNNNIDFIYYILDI